MDKIVKDALEEADRELEEEQQHSSNGKAKNETKGRARHPRYKNNKTRRNEVDDNDDMVKDKSGSDEGIRSRGRAAKPTKPGDRSSSNGVNTSDRDLEEVLEDLQTNISVVGCGGGGCNTIHRMMVEGIEGAELIATNTDVQHLVDIKAHKKLLIGEEKTGGRGAGSVPQIGEEAALEDQEEIHDAIGGSDMVFVTAGLGGGTGTGSAPVIAQAAQDEGALTIAIVTTPFSAEGQVRRNNAEAGLDRLRQVADTVIVVPNDRLLHSVGKMPVNKAFRVADEVLMRSVKGITELITKPGLVNLDFADVNTVMERGDVAMIGLGESDGENKAENSVNSALRSPLLDVNIEGASSALVNVTGGLDMTIDEAEGVVEEIYNRLSDDARIIWGTSVDETLDGEMRTMIVVTGVESPQIFGNKENQKNAPDGIDYVD